MANIKVLGVGAPIACKTVGPIASLSLPRTMAFLHGEYFSGSLHTLPRFMKNDRGICGLVDLSAGFPLPSIEVVRSLRLELYPRFAIADPNSLSLPFRLKGQDVAVRISSPFRRPDGPKPIYRKEEGKLVYEYFSGDFFVDQRRQRILEAYNKGIIVSLSEQNQEYLDWIISQIKPQGRVLSIGIGSGQIEKGLFERYGFKSTGIELSANRGKRDVFPGVTVIGGDAHKVSSVLDKHGIKGKFRTAMAIESFGYFWQESFLRELKGIVEIGGDFFILTPIETSESENFLFPGYHYDRLSALQEKLLRHGFRTAEVSLLGMKAGLLGKYKVSSGMEDPSKAVMVLLKAVREGN